MVEEERRRWRGGYEEIEVSLGRKMEELGVEGMVGDKKQAARAIVEGDDDGGFRGFMVEKSRKTSWRQKEKRRKKLLGRMDMSFPAFLWAEQ